MNHFFTIFLIALLFAVLVGAKSEEKDDKWAGTPQEAFLNSEIVKSYQCTSCHTIGERGGTVGPILNHVGNRRTKDWLKRWLVDPQEVKAGTKMPKFDFPPDQLRQALDYLINMKKEFNTKEILAKNLSLTEKGRLLFDDYDCLGCHRVGSEGRFIGPDLTWIGVRKTREWEKIWLADPPGFKPDTFMPNFHIPEKGIGALTAFLHEQQGQKNEDSQRWEFRTNFFLGNIDKERGELVFKRFGCWSCHGENASGGVKNANMAPDEMMPALKKVANKYTEEEFVTRLKKRTTVKALDPSKPDPPFFCPDYGNYMNEPEVSDLYAYLKSFAPKKSKWRFK